MKTRSQAKTRIQTKKRNKQTLAKTDRIPFMQHIAELRKRLAWVILSVVVFAGVGYAINDQLISWLLRPAADQQFIYTTPGGGLNFLIQVIIYFGIAVSIPVIVYNFFKFIEPLLQRQSSSFITKLTLSSIGLAIGGIAFGYYIGLPSAMHFLAGMLTDRGDIEALLTISDYLSFVTIYLAGAAIMFQLPIIIVFINRIKPLSPRKLLKGERWVIVLAFIAAAIITPTPDMFNQALIAIPIILVYQVGVVLVWLQNRYSTYSKVQNLLANDAKTQSQRNAIEKQLLISNKPLEPIEVTNISSYAPKHQMMDVAPTQHKNNQPLSVS